ncbi:hypothetical protein ATCC90586_010678 [Pythium insidiosum]|nr:hypothetical protein ATCC90586_010678 [Pythium insidiosum]
MVGDREKKQKLRLRAALGMDAEGIDVTEAESAFSLKELGISKAQVDLLDNAADVASFESDDDQPLEFETSEDEDDDDDSDTEYTELLESQMDGLYDSYLR